MISQAERRFIWEHAYVPEHVPEYVSAISGAEAFLSDDFLQYISGADLVFIGYPLKGTSTTGTYEKPLRRAIKRHRPERVHVIGPDMPSRIPNGASASPDHYYRLELERLKISQKVRNMLARASKEISVTKGRNLGEEHTALIEEFISHHRLSQATRSIFSRVPAYVMASESAAVFQARDAEGRLVAFDVAESGARDYLFYLFNFSSGQHYVPGASDLLMKEMIGNAGAQAKKFVNMGLGIGKGITFFKTKWGARSFLPYVSYEYAIPHKEIVGTLLDKL